MNAVDTHQKRLRDEVAAVEKEIQSHNQQVAALNQRLEGLKRYAARGHRREWLRFGIYRSPWIGTPNYVSA
jgi:hypothetical protein